MTSVAAIGLDAAELSFVDHLIAKGKMPNLATFRKRAIDCPLQNDYFRSGLVWQAFVVAGPPEPNAVAFDPIAYEAWNQTVSSMPAFFDVPDSPRTIAFDVPQMTLPRAANGTFVQAWGAHAPGYPRTSWPHGLLNEIDRRFGTHPAFRSDEAAWNDDRSIQDLTERLVRGARKRPAICRFLMERMPDWDFFITTFSEPHSAGEAFWHGVDTAHPLASLATAETALECLERVYSAVDEAVGELLHALPLDCTTVIFSLHGITTNSGDVPGQILLPEFLYRVEHGIHFLEDPDPQEWEREGYPPVVPPTGDWPRPVDRPQATRSLTGSARKIARRTLPLSVKKGLVRAAGRLRSHPANDLIGDPNEVTKDAEEIGLPREGMDFQPAAWYRESWSSSRFFALPTFGDGRVRINLKGRESSGLVDPSDYEATLTEIESLLGGLVNPRTGGKAVAEIIRLERDPLDASTADSDLLVIWTPGVDAIRHPDFGTIGPRRLMRMGGHNGTGFAWLSGTPGPPEKLAVRPVDDLPATLMALLGIDSGSSGATPFLTMPEEAS